MVNPLINSNYSVNDTQNQSTNPLSQLISNLNSKAATSKGSVFEIPNNMVTGVWHGPTPQLRLGDGNSKPLEEATTSPIPPTELPHSHGPEDLERRYGSGATILVYENGQIVCKPRSEEKIPLISLTEKLVPPKPQGPDCEFPYTPAVPKGQIQPYPPKPKPVPISIPIVKIPEVPGSDPGLKDRPVPPSDQELLAKEALKRRAPLQTKPK